MNAAHSVCTAQSRWASCPNIMSHVCFSKVEIKNRSMPHTSCKVLQPAAVHRNLFTEGHTVVIVSNIIWFVDHDISLMSEQHQYQVRTPGLDCNNPGRAHCYTAAWKTSFFYYKSIFCYVFQQHECSTFSYWEIISVTAVPPAVSPSVPPSVPPSVGDINFRSCLL